MLDLSYFKRNNYLLADGKGFRRQANFNEVNTNWWHINYNQTIQNLGDMLSEVVVDYLCKKNGINKEKKIAKTRHLYGIGSIIFFGNQDATVWGSGSLHEIKFHINSFLRHKFLRRLDVRAVRGPNTKKNLRVLNIACPDVFGDPAMLLPLIYNPKKEKNIDYLVINHFRDEQSHFYSNELNIFYTDMLTECWKEKIDLILSAKCVISSSLHGVILAESYGIPAILLKPKIESDLFKYEDYYFGTDRDLPRVVKNITEGIDFNFDELCLPNLNKIQFDLIKSFPVDLWE